jgi:hypothetical protein
MIEHLNDEFCVLSLGINFFLGISTKRRKIFQCFIYNDVLLVKGDIYKLKKVRKAIIQAAGLGTRFLPSTKAMPKEMLPVVDIYHSIHSRISDRIRH